MIYKKLYVAKLRSFSKLSLIIYSSEADVHFIIC